MYGKTFPSNLIKQNYEDRFLNCYTLTIKHNILTLGLRTKIQFKNNFKNYFLNS